MTINSTKPRKSILPALSIHPHTTTFYKKINYRRKDTHVHTLISDRTQLYDRKCSSSFRKTLFSKFFFRQFRLPAVSIQYTEKICSMYGEDVSADIRSRVSGKRVWYMACHCIQNSWPLVLL